MAQLRQIPTALNLDALWERHALLARAAIENPELMLDRDYVERLALAHRAFTEAFLSEAVPC